jgi:hypothetical protein
MRSAAAHRRTNRASSPRLDATRSLRPLLGDRRWRRSTDALA